MQSYLPWGEESAKVKWSRKSEVWVQIVTQCTACMNVAFHVLEAVHPGERRVLPRRKGTHMES